jgi:phosphopantetheinyl transferase (holo-ACP synthase)
MTSVRVDILMAAPVPSRPEVLEPEELSRWTRLHQEADRDRLFTGVVLREEALRQRAGRVVPVERRCRGCGLVDHGEVQPLAAADRARWRTSLSHSGTIVMLAVADLEGVDIDVGIDVESVSRLDPRMARHVLSAPERSLLPQPPTGWSLCGVWTAKEAVLKALGCGLHVSMTNIEIGGSEPGSPAPAVRARGTDTRLRPLHDRPSRLIDVTDVVSDTGDKDAPLRAALMVLGATHVRLAHRRLSGDELLASVA